MARAKPANSKLKNLPVHLAVVPDGNGRWAERNGWPRIEGHRAGVENMYRLLKYIHRYPIKFITLYAFSTENWSRPDDEINGLFDILVTFVNRHIYEIHKQGIRVRHIGRLHQLPGDLQEAITAAVELTRNNTGLTLSIALNYGGRPEIVDAARKLVSAGVAPEDITEETFNRYLYTEGLPDVDLLIRTGDETRLSNFLLWQTAYSEYHFTRVLWPDFRKRHLDRALLSYSQKRRRFGGL